MKKNTNKEIAACRSVIGILEIKLKTLEDKPKDKVQPSNEEKPIEPAICKTRSEQSSESITKDETNYESQNEIMQLKDEVSKLRVELKSKDETWRKHIEHINFISNGLFYKKFMQEESILSLREELISWRNLLWMSSNMQEVWDEDLSNAIDLNLPYPFDEYSLQIDWRNSNTYWASDMHIIPGLKELRINFIEEDDKEMRSFLESSVAHNISTFTFNWF